MSDDGIIFTLGAVFGVSVTALCAAFIYSDLKTEAVEVGAAHWLVEPNGQTTFEWGPKDKLRKEMGE